MKKELVDTHDRVGRYFLKNVDRVVGEAKARYKSITARYSYCAARLNISYPRKFREVYLYEKD